ncbi:hypothetical protein TNCV_2763341 [Trichonephila clavipes]|nr:hypothetical protein TNCV_2763341 [Trichonephila clavipes]
MGKKDRPQMEEKSIKRLLHREGQELRKLHATCNFAESHDALRQRFKMAAVLESSRWSTVDNNLLVQHSTNNLMELSEIQKFTSAHFR